ncbi:MAG: S8 family serine peptidase [Planctomycetota bacterium JB042]
MPLRTVFLLLGLLAATGGAGEAELVLGEKLSGTIDHPGDVDEAVLEALQGERITVKVKGKKGLKPFAELEDASTGAPLGTFPFEKGLGKGTFQIKKFPAPATATYRLRIRSANGKGGAYTASTSGKLQKDAHLKFTRTESMQAGEIRLVPFDVKAGTKLTATAKPSSGSGAVPSLSKVTGPFSDTDLAPFLSASGTTVKVKKAPLSAFGEHFLVLQNVGAAGAIDVQFSLKPPKVKKKSVKEPFEGTGGISGVVTAADITVQPEQEPNDLVAQTQFVGSLFPGKLSRVLGAVGNGAAGPADVDGYRYQLDGSQTVYLVLLHDVSVDFDVELYDGDTGAFLGALATEQEPEEGLLAVTLPPGGTAKLDVVVYAWSGTGNYLLRLLSGPPGSSGLAASAGEAGFAFAPAGPAVHVPSPPIADRYFGIDEEFVPGEVIVKLNDASADREAWAAARGDAVRVASPAGPFVVRLGGIDDVDDDLRRRRTALAVAEFSLDPAVAYAEPNHLRRAFATPNDTYYPLQWHYPLVKLPQAWDVTKGSSNVVVAILDTGVVAHPDLVPRDSGTGFDFVSLPQNALDGDGFDPDPTDVGDQAYQDGRSSWHGTHVAGTVGASTNDGQGVAGVDWNCKLMHLRVLGKLGGADADIAEAIRYAAGLPNASFQVPPKRADVINMSLGGYGYNQTVADAVTAARAAGVVVVAAAGNDDTSQLSYPASYPGVISVSAVQTTKQKASYSNFGSAIDVAAPGGDDQADLNQDGYPDGVLSTLVDEQANAYAFDFYPGTSMASPHVAGICALLLSVNPSLTPDQIESILTSTAEDLGAGGWDPVFGHGLVDAFAAVQAAAGPPTGGPKLSVSAGFLDFGGALDQQAVTIANSGGGALSYSATDQEFQGANWLSITPSSGGAPATMQVKVNRTGLAPGVYTGLVSISSNGGNAQIDVRMEVSTGGGAVLDLGTIHVLAVDPAFFGTLGVGTAQPGSGAYALSSLPTGAWIVAAGPDLDGDGFICGVGEPCGLAPPVADPALVSVLDGQITFGVDFVVGDVPILPTFAGGAAPVLPREGFPIP